MRCSMCSPGLCILHGQPGHPLCAGAEDYYNYLFYKASAENGTVAEDGTTYTLEADGSVTAAAADGTTTTYAPVDFDTVGVKAVDEHTLTYTLCFDFPGFVSLLSYAPTSRPTAPCWKSWATSSAPAPRPPAAAARSIWRSMCRWKAG